MSYPYPYSGPIALENNPRIQPEYYAPSRFIISDISLGFTTIVTTTQSHNYVIGQLVRLLVPFYYGTFQINNQDGYVISIPAANQVKLDIDSVGYNAFIASPTYVSSLPQIIPLGDINNGAVNSHGNRNQQTYIDGSFINISPL